MTFTITIGCGSSGVLQPDGTWLVTVTHGNGCPPEHHQIAEDTYLQRPVGVFGDLARLALGDEVVPSGDSLTGTASSE